MDILRHAPGKGDPSTSGHRARLTRIRRLEGVVVAGILLLFASPPLIYEAAAATARPFSASSPFNTAIRSAPAIDGKSAAMVARASRTGQVPANLVEYGIPVYTAGPSTPLQHVTCTYDGAWGRCPLSQSPRKIPGNASPNTGDDGVLTVLDPAAGSVDEYWRARHTSGGWTTAWGAVNTLTGSGWGGASTGAGASRIAGVVRVSEIQAGRIDHALVLQSDDVCAAVARPPALKTDGDSTRGDCLPEGSRLQLDPKLDVATLSGLTSGERTVARAMQVYGGYVIDRGGAPLSVSFERAPDAGRTPGSVYTAAGLAWDYYGLTHVPWSRLRVLRTWNG